MANFLGSVRAITTDYGTEVGLAESRNIDLSDMFPWTFDGLSFDEIQPGPAELPLGASPGEVEPLIISPHLQWEGDRLLLPTLFPLGLQVPGALRVLHKAVEDLTQAFEHYEDWFLPGVEAIARVFNKHTRERFVVEVLRESEASGMEMPVRELELNLHKHRWGSLINTCKELLFVRMVFAYWDPQEAAPDVNADQEVRETYAALCKMTECVRDESCWEYLCMLIRLSRVIDRLEHFFESCPCHYRKVPESSLAGNVIFQTRSSCCMAGRRAPELAAGILDKIASDDFALQRAELVSACRTLQPHQSEFILKDFAAGQARLEQYLLVKLSFWKSLPHKLCVLGHHNEQVARDGLQEAKNMFEQHRDSPNHHALTLHFFQGPLSLPVDSFLAGSTGRDDCTQLLRESAALAFVSCVERSIEGRHALMKAKTAVMKRISPATFSLAIRSHEFHRRCLADKQLFRVWESQVLRLKVRPRQGAPHVLMHLDFMRHPEILRLQNGPNRIKLRDAANVIYHCDLLTQYDRRSAAAKALSRPDFRDDPDAAAKLRQLVAGQPTALEKQRAMLRVLMLEHFSKNSCEGQMYSVTGALPEPRLLEDVFRMQPAARAPEALPLQLQMPQGHAHVPPDRVFMSPDPQDLSLAAEPAEPGEEIEALVLPADTAPTLFLQAPRACNCNRPSQTDWCRVMVVDFLFQDPIAKLGFVIKGQPFETFANLSAGLSTRLSQH